MIHGINANHLSWRGWIGELAADHRTIALDLPGHGLTGPDPARRYTWAEMADRVHDLVTALGLERFMLCGNSLGGAVSLEYALAHPDKLDALVLIDSIGFPQRGPKPPALEAASRPLLGKLLIWTTPRWVIAGALRSTYADPARLDDATIDAYHDLLLRAGNRRAAREVLLRGVGQGLAGRIAALTVPTLILWGGRDTWTRPANADWFATHIPHAKLVRFPALGHLPMAEDPGPTAAALRDFLATLPPA
jgi:pimeloyl-ACP methyl ester carboxylesterase